MAARASAALRLVALAISLSAVVVPQAPALAQNRDQSPIMPPGEGMIDQPCPAPDVQAQLWFGHPYVRDNDWAWLCRYRADNQRVMAGPRPDVVFIGDSITEGWVAGDPALFASNPAHIGRGISGQTSPQILLRFSQDVLALRPRAVHIMVGTNDIGGNTGPTSAAAYQDAIRAMVTLARAHHIAVIIGSILPAERFYWRPAITPAPHIRAMNDWLRDYARAEHLVFADYHSALATPAGALNPAASGDGVHPNAAGYAIMRPITDAAIARALHRRR